MAISGGSNLDIAVQLRFLDAYTQHINAPIAATNRLKAAIDSTVAVASRSQAAMARLAQAYDNLAARAERSHAKMTALRGRALGVAAGAFGLAFPLLAAADYELKLARFGHIAGWTGDTHARRILEVNDALARVSRTTAQSTMDLLGAVSTIVGVSGRVFETGGQLDIAKLETTMAAVARWAAAAGVSLEDAGRATAVLFQNAGLSANALERAFDIVTTGGKLGGFEAPDSARWFPGMLASYGTMFAGHIQRRTAGMSPEQVQRFRDGLGLGMVANLTTFLQMARLGAADANIAGNNLVNLIQKMFIPETAKNYQKQLGIDFQKMMHEAVLRGDDPIFEVIKSLSGLIDKHGGNIFKTGLVYADRQALEGVLPILDMYRARRDEFERLFREIRGAGGTIKADLETALKTTRMHFYILRAGVKQFWNELLLGGGTSSLSAVFGLLSQGLWSVNLAISGNRGLASVIIRLGFGIVGALGGLVLLRFALAGLSLMFARAGMGAITLLNVIPGLGSLLSAGGVLGSGLSILGLGLIGGAGFLAYQYWDTLKSHITGPLEYLTGFFERLLRMFPSLDGFFKGFEGWIGNFEPLLARVRRLAADLRDFFRYLLLGESSEADAFGEGNPIERLRKSFSGLGGDLGTAFPQLTTLSDWWDDFKSKLKFEQGNTWGESFGAWGKTLLTGRYDGRHADQAAPRQGRAHPSRAPADRSGLACAGVMSCQRHAAPKPRST